MNGLTWLHLSDWHQQGDDFNRTVVRDALLRDLRERGRLDPALSEVDFVIFSGDVAWSGRAEEFQAAREQLFDPVLKELNLKPDKLFIIPGNHDLSRAHVKKFMPPALQKPLANETEAQEWLTDDEGRAIALSSFKNFANFVTTYTGQKPPTYANTWTGFIGNKTVGILCLNSAWMCGRNVDATGKVNDYGFLTLGEAQLHAALGEIEGADMRLAVLHHPFPWLTDFDRDRIEERLKHGCHFILHGHEHQPKFSLGSGLSGECAVIPAGACYDRRVAQNPRFINAYNFVRLDFETGRGTIFLRRWNDPGNAWIEDTASQPGGKFPFPLPKELGSPKPPATPLPPKSGAKAVQPEPIGVSTAIQAYLHRLEADTSKLKLIGLGQGVQIELPIEQAYIPLNVVVARDLKSENQFHFDEKALRLREQFEENVLLCDIFKWAKRFDSRGVLLLGDPGAGKTTGARQFCWRVLQEPDLPKSLGLPTGTLPVFLRLRNLTPQHLAKGLPAFINDSTSASLLPADLANPGPELLARKRVLWVFDGLDEVVSEKARVHVCGWIKQALADRPDDFILVTSRYQGYQGRVDLGPAFCQFHVRPLISEQVADFVAHWYRAVCCKLHGAGNATEERAANLVGSLMELLQQPEYRIGRLRELPANPLMLTILCVVHHQDRNLPRRRADLYAKCVRVLVEHWRKEVLENQGVAGFLPEAAEGVLASVAWSLHGQEKRTSQTIEELGAIATKALADVAPSANLGRDGEAFVKRMRDESGILAMWSAGQCGFLHLTFQEYLAGFHAAREGRVDELVQQIGQSWWREVILVAIAIGSREFALKFFTALLQTDAVARQGEFVDQCLDEAGFAVLEPFITALRSNDTKLQQKLRLLMMLRNFNHDGLTVVCRELARSPMPDMSSLAQEIVQRAGVALEQPTIEVVGVGSLLPVHVDPRTGSAFIRIPAGEFDMGSNHGDEKPVHRVRLSEPFLLGKYTVTNQEYQRFLEADPSVGPPHYWSDSQFNDPRQPVVGVSWEDAQAFCRWAGCRLPTEAEWEYACRAGSRKKYCFGDDESKLEEYAWFGKNSGGKLHPVGEKKPNAWGLFDMHGNVWEWCQDWYGTDYYQSSPKLDPTGPEKGGARVLRGGSFDFEPVYLRCSYRNGRDPDGRYHYVGFRVVCAGASAG